MKKLIMTLVLGILLLNIFQIKVYGVEESNNSNEAKKEEQLNLELDDEEAKNIEESNKVKDLYDYINKMKTDEEILSDLSTSDYVKSFFENGTGNITAGNILEMLASPLIKELKSVIKLMISVLVIAIISSLIKNLQSAFTNSNLSNIAFYACYAVLIILVSKSIIISVDVVKDTIQAISEFMNVLLPVIVIMIAGLGGFAQAASLDPVIVICTTTLPKLYIYVIIPMVLMSFVLTFVNNISLEHKIGKLCKSFKSIILYIQGFIITIFIGILTIRGISTSTIDVVTMKTAKFAIDNFIPIVGKAFSDAISSVAGYSLILKNAISSLGLLITILIVLLPIIKIALISMTFKITAGLIEPICDSRITSTLSSCGDHFTVLMSCILSVGLMFFIMVCIMASAGKYVVGG